MKLKPLSYIPLLVLSIIFIYPFWWMIVNSLNTAADILNIPSLLPRSWQWNNYIEIFKVQPFALQYINTLFISILGTAGNIMISTLAGYSFARLKFPGRNTAFIFLLTALMMPIEVTIIPLFFQMKTLQLLDTFVPLILIPIFASQGAFSTFLMRQYFITLPKELEEAAYMDGASKWYTLVKVVVPLVVSGLLAVGIYSFLLTWDDYLHALTLIQKDALRTLSVGIKLRYLGEFSYDWSLVNCISVVGALPMVFVFFFFQRYMIKGLTAGAVKE